MLDAVIIVRSIKINNLEDGNNCSELILIAIVVATLKCHGDVVTLVLLLAEGEVFNRLWLSTFIITPVIGLITEFCSDFFSQISGVVDHASVISVD